MFEPNYLPYLIGFVGVLGIAAASLTIIKLRAEELAKFRGSLRPGDHVRIVTPRGKVRARIIRRDSSLQFVAIETHNKTLRLVPISNIYQP